MRLPQDRILHIDTECKDGKVNITAEWQGEIVRCKDCVHREIMRDPLRTPMDCFGCDIMHRNDDDDYCSYGERRE